MRFVGDFERYHKIKTSEIYYTITMKKRYLTMAVAAFVALAVTLGGCDCVAAVCAATGPAGSAAYEEHSSQTVTSNEVDRIAAEIAEWLRPYQKKIGAMTERDGEDVYFRGTFGALPSVFSTFDITVAIYAKDREVSFVAYLPTIVSEKRRKDMVEFIFRGEWEYGISPASIILETDGRVRCQAWMPFEGFALQPEEAKRRLMGAVVDKLWSFSEGVASVALGGDPAEAAAAINRRDVFEGLGEAAELGMTADVDTKIVLERCFDKDAEITVDESSDKWLDALARRDGGSRVGIINGHFEDVVRDMGGRYDVLPYSLVVRDGMVWNVCNVPEVVPDEVIGKAADWAMRMNEGLKYSLFNIDFDTGKMWCHYGLPVSVLPSCDELPPRNLYGALLKIIPVRSVATHSEDLHLALVEALLHADDSEGAAMSSVENLSRRAQMVAAWLREHLNGAKREAVTNSPGQTSVSGSVCGRSSNADDCSFGCDAWQNGDVGMEDVSCTR